jgi:hypothetical protein
MRRRIRVRRRIQTCQGILVSSECAGMRSGGRLEGDTCMLYEEEDTCMPNEEEDT